MNEKHQTVEAGTALHTFVETFGSQVAVDVARSLTCAEVDALADLLKACHRAAVADDWLRAHALDDEYDDAHVDYLSEILRKELEEIAANYGEITLQDEEPDAFGGGHLVLARGERTDTRFAITDQTDKPSDDETRKVTGWHWVAQTRSEQGWTTTSSGEATAENVDTLTDAAWRWAANE